MAHHRRLQVAVLLTVVALDRTAVVIGCIAKATDGYGEVVSTTTIEVASVEVRVCSTDAVKVPASIGRAVGRRVFGLRLTVVSRAISRGVVSGQGLTAVVRRVTTHAKRAVRV